MGFSPIHARPAPAGRRAPDKERNCDRRVYHHHRADYRKAQRRRGPVAQAVAEYRSAAKPCIEEALSWRQCLAAQRARLRLALLGDDTADKRAWRIGPQGREGDARGVLAGLRRWRRIEDRRARAGESRNGRPGKRRFVLRYYSVFNSDQCELPSAIVEKL